ncbi:hypothetical protein SIN8267_00001 [Sinobacterium norvegicum]|uniref:Uncharacterized protein n=1 Tax=Sinobacterium norvegicum TaxID=1641715 RepID=A0ABN8EBQ0_9GAMM|nr:hypothetical protein SIN8267_00001 [Sinobacterium norvegicum]
MLHLGERVVDLIGPSATDRIDGEATEIARCGSHTPAVVIFATGTTVGIDIAGDHLTAGGEEEGIVVFGDIAKDIAGGFDDGSVIGAGNGDGDDLIDNAALAVIDGDGKRFSKGIAET